MTAFHSVLLYCILYFSWLWSVDASSRQPPPLKRLEHPQAVSLQIVSKSSLSKRNIISSTDSRPVRHSDTLRITLNAFDDVFHLHLRPNNDLIHPAARIKYVKPPSASNGQNPADGSSGTVRVEPLLRESILVYGGEVIHDSYTDTRLDEDVAGGIKRPHGSPEPAGHRGWARITVLDGGNVETGRTPIFEGAFSVDGVIHHIMTKESYQVNKQNRDPEVVDLSSGLVIFRDSDLMSFEELHGIQNGGGSNSETQPKRPQTCAHDRFWYNVDTATNPVLRYGAGLDRNSQGPWYDPFGLISPDNGVAYNSNPYVKRQGGDIGGGGNSTSNFVDTIGQTAGCPTTQQIVYLGVVSDCTYTQINGGNANATQQILKNFNTVSLLYKSTFNISLGIVELQISDATCPTNDSANPWNLACSSASLNERLSLFSQWRGQKDPNADPSGLWHLMSGCPSGTEVGVAWLGTICMKKASGDAPSIVSGTGVSTNGRTEWQVIAHEIGHNFGAIHDCTDGCSLSDNCCPKSSTGCDSNNQFLMNPTSSSSEQTFSPCTIGNICSLMMGASIDMSCINPPDPNQRTFSLQMCGNGIVEAGEECDPGAGSTSSCCDPNTCKFINGAVCDPASSSCCTSSCQFAPATQVCRPAKDTKCDLAETCTGTSPDCPADKTAPNGQSCGAGGLACANGQCTSLTQQCRTAGASLNLTNACPSQSDSSCQVSCQDPRNLAQCIVLNSQLVDGSPCGYGGTCFSGNCRAGSFLETAVAWYTQNLQISIPVSVVVGIVCLIIIWAILTGLRRFLTRRHLTRMSKERSTPIPSTAAPQRLPSWAPPPPGSTNNNHMVAAGPFLVPEQRLQRNGSGSSSRGNAENREIGRRSIVQRGLATINTWKGKMPSLPTRSGGPGGGQAPFPIAPGYARSRTVDRTNWVDETEYNGPRG